MSVGEEEVGFLSSSLSLFKSPNIRKKTIMVFIIWMMISMSYHGTNLSQASSGSQVYLIFTFGSALEIPICFLILFLVDRVGRRFLIIFSLAIVAVISPFTFFLNKDSMWLTLCVSVVIRGLFSLAYNVFCQLASELFPTTARGRGICLMRALGDVGTTIVPQILNLKTFNPVIPTMVFSGMAILAGLLALLLPETMNQPLPHTVEDAELFGKGQGICFCPAFHRAKRADTEVKVSKNCQKWNNPSTLESEDIQKDFTIHL